MSIPRRPPVPPRPAVAAVVRPWRIPLLRRAMVWVLMGEVMALALAIGLRIRGVTWEWASEARGHLAMSQGGVGWIAEFLARWPMRSLNTVMEGIAAVGVFLLVRLWSVRGDLAPARESAWRSAMELVAGWITSVKTKPRMYMRSSGGANETATKAQPYQGWGRGLAAALLLWLNPALLLCGHGWGASDVLAVPFIVFAIFACSVEWWLAGGLLVGIALMLKGQVMLAAPVFVLWPLFMNAPRAATRCAIGIAGGLALCLVPTLVGSGAVWVAGVMLVPAMVRRKWFNRGPLGSIAVMAPLAFALVVWPAMLAPNRTVVATIVLATLGLGLAFIGRKLGGVWLATLVVLAGCCALFLCPMLFDGTVDGLRAIVSQTGLVSEQMSAGAANLPSILNEGFGVRAGDGLWTIDLPAFSIYHVVTVKQGLFGVYVITLLVASASAGVHGNRNDPRALVGLVIPWVLFYALLPGMGERGLAWGAALGACWVAVGSGMTLVHLLISGLGFLLIASGMNHDGDFAMGGLVRATEGALGCLVVLAGLMVGWGAIGARDES